MNEQDFYQENTYPSLPLRVKAIIVAIVVLATVIAPACEGGAKSSTAYQTTAAGIQTAETSIASVNITASLTSATVITAAASSINTGSADRFTVPWAKPAGTSLPYLTFYNSLRYTNDWLWVKQESADTVKIGFTDYAQLAMGSVWSVDFSKSGSVVKRGDTFGFIQGEDTMDVNLQSPVAGVLMSVNQAVLADYYLINWYPYDAGWLVTMKMSNPDDLNLLLTAAQYARQCCPPCHCNN